MVGVVFCCKRFDADPAELDLENEPKPDESDAEDEADES